MKIINNPSKQDWQELLKRPTQTVEDIETTVAQIFDEVQQKGDEAISKYTSFFDGILIENTQVSSQEINQSIAKVSNELKEAIQLQRVT